MFGGLQGSLCANETLCTNETNLKLNISQINYDIAMIFDSKYNIGAHKNILKTSILYFE